MKQEMSILGIDVAKRVFHAVGMDNTGKIVFRKRLSRHDLMPFIAKLPPVLIGMEACGGAHYWARRFRAYGHEVKLRAPQCVTPYVKSNKNDSRDAEAIAAAVTRPTMRFVPTKEVDQQDIQALHRVRERLIGERTALVNEVYGLLHEYGIVMPKGVSKFRHAVVGKLESAKDKLTPLSQEMCWKWVEEFAALDAQLAYYQEKFDTLAQTHPECQRLMTIPDIGPCTATALVAAVSDASAFKNGRQFAAWLGLVPRQHTTGGKERLLGMSKRGDPYLRKLLVHGARATTRIKGLLSSQGIRLTSLSQFPEQLDALRLWDGSEIPSGLRRRVLRVWAHHQFLSEQIAALAAERRALLQSSEDARIAKVRQLMHLKGIGINGVWLLVMDFFGWRELKNRREVGGFAGLTPTPYHSGESAREQGITKSGNRHVRWMTTELAWSWIRYQPESALSCWFRERFGSGGKRLRRIGIVAVARKLLIALRRFLNTGVLPEGAELKAA